ncbi:Nif11-like leader peptide family natural product precursor [Pseudoroseomonas cervicalis]|uniref:Nif11-like leader peptide family natural product precursor n=1 Tax=Teichococcus cervicalis TaxID=204525 RepID=UPI0022F152FB|nr:Nif11-like leader peptide family natural product precursor [Pseudoroseomonas cervicalis]WBV43156.1 Nif11-like leader peptide family natural product precursor [Pseudoroseomonas cervicalis]
MASSEWQRLDRDLRQDAALREALGTALRHCRSPQEAAALLQGQGYAVTAAELSAGDAALPDEALDQLAGGGFWDMIRDLAPTAPILLLPR